MIDNFVILQREAFRGFLKETNNKNCWFFCVQKEGEIKHEVVNVSKPWHQVTSKQEM